MKADRILLLLITAIALCSQPVSGAMLTFDSATPGTIADTNGLGSGFTHRLPGSGSAISTNDPNLDLLANPGYLTLRSTQTDINYGGVNLGQLEAPGFFLPSIGTQDVGISALFRDVRVPNGSDQLFLYFGTATMNVVRAGFHFQDLYVIAENQGGSDVLTFLGGLNTFAAGDDVLLTFGRTSGLWKLTWQNLTTPSASGSSPTVSWPWLDAAPDLYAGVLASNAGSGTSFTAKIDSISVVPEPSTGIVGILALGVGLLRRNRPRKVDS